MQSVARAFSLLEHLADAGGALGVTEMATVSGLPPPTIHRLLRSLVSQGYVRQDSSRRYAIGPRLIRIGEAASRMLGAWATPFLTELVQRVGETANMALLDGDGAVYVAQVPSRNTVRMFTEVGRVVQLPSTGVGKALLSLLSDDEIRAIVARTGLPAVTEHTITSPSELLASVERARRIGYTIDNGEQELGVRCVAVPIPGLPFKAALSVSGPSSRVSVGQTSVIAPVLQEVAVQMREGFPSGV